MAITKGVEWTGDKNKYVCKLTKSLYGSKQASRSWNQTFCRFLSVFNFKECETDKCIFVGNIMNDVV